MFSTLAQEDDLTSFLKSSEAAPQSSSDSTTLMDASIASFELMDFNTNSAGSCMDLPPPARVSDSSMPMMDFSMDLSDASLEPKPLSEDNIQLVNELPLNSFLSADLLQNCHEYCEALKTTPTPMTGGFTLPSFNHHQTLLRSTSVPGLAMPKAANGFTVKSSFGNIPCPKPGISRGSSDTSMLSTVSNGSDNMVHIYDYQQERWMDRYAQLAAFFQEHGNSDVSNEFDSNLAGWVRRQRHQFKRAKQGRRSTLTVARVQLLEQVGFKWDFHDLAWNENFERLKQFYQIHKHTNVPTSSAGCNKEDNDKLLNWCKRQKRAIRMYVQNKEAVGSRMNQKRFELLQSIGFRWQPVKRVESPAAA